MIEKKTYEQLAEKVNQWAVDKGITEKATPLTQWNKMLEEVIETRDALVLKNAGVKMQDRAYIDEKIEDGIGDVLVTVIILALLTGKDSVDCLEYAYNEIKNRTGKMINGTFVKDK